MGSAFGEVDDHLGSSYIINNAPTCRTCGNQKINFKCVTKTCPSYVR